MRWHRMNNLKKIINIIKTECKARGIYYFLLMYLSNIFALIKGLLYKCLYFRNINSTLFFIQGRTKIDVFSKHCRLVIRPFVYIRRNGTIRMDNQGMLYIGDKVFINDNCNINCIYKIHIGEYTKIGPNVSINDNDHNFRGIEEGRMLTGEVHIGKHVWIGANTVILRGTTIGDYAVIAAGSIVKGEVPEHSIYLNNKENKIIPY